MATSISHSPAETAELGEAWGRAVQQGQVIALSGEMGAGKTHLVKGLARGLGTTERVHSPTFTLLNIYRGGRLPLFHLDLFRLETREQISAAGLEEYFQPQGIAVIEWPEFWFGSRKSVVERQGRLSGSDAPGTPSLPASLRWVQIEIVGEMERRFIYEDFGA